MLFRSCQRSDPSSHRAILGSDATLAQIPQSDTAGQWPCRQADEMEEEEALVPLNAKLKGVLFAGGRSIAAKRNSNTKQTGSVSYIREVAQARRKDPMAYRGIRSGTKTGMGGKINPANTINLVGKQQGELGVIVNCGSAG